MHGARIAYNPATGCAELAFAAEDWHIVNNVAEGRSAMHHGVYRHPCAAPFFTVASACLQPLARKVCAISRSSHRWLACRTAGERAPMWDDRTAGVAGE